jgi:flagellar motor switch protein FliN
MNAKLMTSNLHSILSLEVPLIVEISQRRMPLAEAVHLVRGAIVEFPQASNGELRILINNKAIGTGTAVKGGENFGVRVSAVGDMTSRVEALKS